MEKELQGKLVEILTNIQSNVGQAKDFALSQLPDVAQSYVAYGRIDLSAQLALALFGTVYLLWFAVKQGFASEKVDSYGNWTVERSMAAFLGTAFGAFGVLITCHQLSLFVLVWVAPKVWLLKELAHIVQ